MARRRGAAPRDPIPYPPLRRRLVVGGLALVLVLAGSFTAFRHLRPREVRRERGLSVLLVTIDTLRADALGCYGRTGGETPRIDRLAASGVRFDFAHAHNVVTLPSHASILSGRYPFDHGVRENSGFRFRPGMETLATLLRARAIAPAPSSAPFPSTPASASTAASTCTTTASATRRRAPTSRCRSVRARRRWPRHGRGSRRRRGRRCAGCTSTSPTRPTSRPSTGAGACPPPTTAR